MKKTIFSVLLLFFLSLAVYADPMNLPADVKEAFAKAGMPLLRQKRSVKDFSLKTAEGKDITLSSLKGKVVFLNFWATWCPPCRTEMPSMEILHQRYKNDGLEFVAVDIMESRGVIQDFMRENTYTFPVAMDTNGDVSSKYGVQAIPATFIIDRDSKIIFYAPGARNWNTPEVFAAFERLLKNER
jgi:thiol-disulfide isomerase/thioredoxin